MDLMKAMGRLLPKLGQMLKDEYDLHTGIRKKIQSLSRELEDVHAVLRMVGEVPPEQLDGTVELWAHDLREASKKVRKLFEQSNARRKIAGDIQKMNRRLLVEVAARRSRYTERFFTVLEVVQYQILIVDLASSNGQKSSVPHGTAPPLSSSIIGGKDETSAFLDSLCNLHKIQTVKILDDRDESKVVFGSRE
uniref:Disease resistance N-terminal domain-containing protein n=1 Tax=Oryza sativa subsp. japonica TaxID=39947 RepID=Q6YYL5_ORYSJ|nr:hypothetical protein [Oryza sativa Japonica Group]BAD05790.1 hypothetical protein [Oryza sativa Japonica Group]